MGYTIYEAQCKKKMGGPCLKSYKEFQRWCQWTLDQARVLLSIGLVWLHRSAAHEAGLESCRCLDWHLSTYWHLLDSQRGNRPVEADAPVWTRTVSRLAISSLLCVSLLPIHLPLCPEGPVSITSISVHPCLLISSVIQPLGGQPLPGAGEDMEVEKLFPEFPPAGLHGAGWLVHCPRPWLHPDSLFLSPSSLGASSHSLLACGPQA